MKQKTISSHHFIRLPLCLLVSLLLATTGGLLRAQLITFEFRGHMTEPSGLDLQVGDSFVADYTFDPTTPATGNTGTDWDTQYFAITSWRFSFDRGYSFAPSDMAPNEIILANNKPVTPGGIDRYTATFYNVVSTGLPLPSGRGIEFLQLDLDDWIPSGNPDMLDSLSIPTTPPDPARSMFAGGRFLLADGAQPYFEVDSIAVVPELSAPVILIVCIVVWFLLRLIGSRVNSWNVTD
jgi:hypothetical protein